MHLASVLYLDLAASSGGGAAQARDASPASPSQQEPPEEIVVRGARLTELRLEVEKARVRAYDVFNEINTDDDFDVQCTEAARTGTRLRRQVCRARFEDRISSRAGQEYLAALSWRCTNPAALVDCMFDDRASGAISAAQGVESEALTKRDELMQEIRRLAYEDPRFAQAILDWYEANRRYEDRRRRGRGRER